MTTTMATATTQEREGSELEAIFRHLFGDMPERAEYEYVRVPGLHLSAELDDVIEPDADYVVWQTGETEDGRKLLVVYCRREKVGRQTPVAQAPSGSATAARSTGRTNAARAGVRRRAR